MFRLVRLFLTISVVLLFCITGLYADTVILKGGQRIKGLILDEFKDRIVISTVDGEKVVMKSDIRSALYDNEAKALIRKARGQVKKRQYIKAYNTYAKALELDPELAEARDQFNFLRSFLETKMKYDIIDSVKEKKEKREGVERKTPSERVTDELEMTLTSDDKYIYIKKVRGESADVLKAGDKIVSVWGELTAYMDTEEVAEMLLKPKECRLVIERVVTPKFSSNKSSFNKVFANGYEKIIGAKLKLVKRGVIVENVVPGGPFKKSGIAEGDLLYRIKEKNTRYLPMPQIIDIIKENRDKEVEIVVRRDITIWKKKETI